MDCTGQIFDVERFSTVDGPGIRTVAFLKGCNLHCDWCHNPEGYQTGPQLMYDETQCMRCGGCVQVCPRQVHRLDGDTQRLRTALLDPGAWLRMLREGAATTYEGWGRDTKWNTSLFHLTMAYALAFLIRQ